MAPQRERGDDWVRDHLKLLDEAIRIAVCVAVEVEREACARILDDEITALTADLPVLEMLSGTIRIELAAPSVIGRIARLAARIRERKTT